MRTGALLYLTNHARMVRNHPDRPGAGLTPRPPRSSWNTSHHPQPSGCKPTSAHAQNDKAKALLSLRKYPATRRQNQRQNVAIHEPIPPYVPTRRWMKADIHLAPATNREIPEENQMANLTFNAIDVETANRTRASICQIGIAQVQVGKISRAASFLINPEEPFESFQTSLHGINEEAVSEAETMLSIHPKLYRLIERTPLASHSPFDKQALEKAASKYGLTMPQIKWLDTGRVARSAWPDRYDGSSWGLKKIATDLGIEFLHHDAAEDARAAAEILLQACRHTGLDVDDWLEQAGYERTPAAQTNTPAGTADERWEQNFTGNSPSIRSTPMEQHDGQNPNTGGEKGVQQQVRDGRHRQIHPETCQSNHRRTGRFRGPQNPPQDSIPEPHPGRTSLVGGAVAGSDRPNTAGLFP